MFEWWNWFVETARGFSMISMLIRLMLAVVVGTAIGIDRSVKHRGAGIKTHTLVCLGAAVVMMTSQHISLYFTEKADVARLGAQVISGVGFLGVGTIIVTGKNQIKGLTTAAGLWTCACIGLAAGIGYVEGVVLCLILVLFTFKVLNRVDLYLRKHAKNFDYYLEFDNNRSVVRFMEVLRHEELKLSVFELSKNKLKGEGPTAIVSIEVKDKKKRELVPEIIRSIEGIKFVEDL